MRTKLKAIGLDGLAMLALSNAVILATAGVTLLGFALHVARTAQRAPLLPQGRRWLMVPGKRLASDLPDAEFIRRLERVCRIHDAGGVEGVMLLGGVTAGNTLTEAEAGRRYLMQRGIAAERIVLEQDSVNTLENFRFAKRRLAPQEGVVIISSRYHLARCSTMARSLQIEHGVCAAEESLRWSAGTALLLLKEAYHLHWYWSGRRWAELTRNEKMLRRLR